MVFILTDVLTKMMNFKNVFRWHFPFLILLSLVSVRALGRYALGFRRQSKLRGPGLAPLAARWQQDDNAIRVVKAITLSQQASAQPLLMQIRLPPNYGKRYMETFSAIYPTLASRYAIPLLPFFMEQVYLRPERMQDDGIIRTPNPSPRNG